MRRNLKHVKHLLDLVQAYADETGTYLHDLLPKWEESGGNPEAPLEKAECVFLINLCADAGFLTVSGGNEIQLTWAGYEYLDSVTAKPTL